MSLSFLFSVFDVVAVVVVVLFFLPGFAKTETQPSTEHLRHQVAAPRQNRREISNFVIAVVALVLVWYLYCSCLRVYPLVCWLVRVVVDGAGVGVT